MANQGIPILFEVAGGANINGQSGVNIKHAIQAIVNQIEKQGITKLKFTIDPESVKELEKIKQTIQAITQMTGKSGTTNSTNTIPFSTNNVASESKKAMSASTAEMTRAKIVTEQVRTESAKLVGQKQVEIATINKTTAVTKSETAEIGKSTAEKKNETAEIQKSIAQKRAEKQAIDETTAAEKEDINSRKEVASKHNQFNNILRQSQDYYSKYQANISKNIELNGKWQSLMQKMSDDKNWAFSQQGRDELSSLQKESRSMGVEAETLGQKLKNLFNQHFSTAIALIGVHLLQQALSQVYQNVIELDKAVVNLQVATGYSREQTQELVATYSNYAKELGATTVEVADAADAWLNKTRSNTQKCA